MRRQWLPPASGTCRRNGYRLSIFASVAPPRAGWGLALSRAKSAHTPGTRSKLAVSGGPCPSQVIGGVRPNFGLLRLGALGLLSQALPRWPPKDPASSRSRDSYNTAARSVCSMRSGAVCRSSVLASLVLPKVGRTPSFARGRLQLLQISVGSGGRFQDCLRACWGWRILALATKATAWWRRVGVSCLGISMPYL